MRRRQPSQPPPFKLPKELPPSPLEGDVVVMHSFSGLVEVWPREKFFGKRRKKKDRKDT
jgi:hypothetical protein